MKIPFKKGKGEWGEVRGGGLCTRGGEARTQGHPPAPQEPRATLPSLLPKPVHAPGEWQLLMGEISAGEEGIGWGSPLAYHGHGWGGGTSLLPWGHTSKTKPQTQGVLQQWDSRGAGQRPQEGSPPCALRGTGDTGGDAGGTGGVRVALGAAAARAGALQYCGSVTRGPHAPSPRGLGTRTRPWWGGAHPGYPTCGCPTLGPPPRTHGRYHPSPPHPLLHLQSRSLTSSCGETEARPPRRPTFRTLGGGGGWRPHPHLSRRDGGAAAQLDDHLLAVVQRPAVAQLVQRAGRLGQHPHTLARARQEAGREVAAGQQQCLGVFPWGGVAFRLTSCRGQSQGQYLGRP